MTDRPTFYHTLPNGIRLVHRLTDSPVSYLGFMVGTGTRDEQPAQNGMAHFIEHTVFKGTTTRSARQIINQIEGTGGELNAYTTKEETAFYAATLTTYFEKAMDLLSDMVFRPVFPDEEIDKERLVIYDEIQSYNDSPSELIYDDFEALLFDGHSLQLPILGAPRTLRWLNGKKAQQFMQDTYNTDQMVFFSLSSLPFEKVVKWAEHYLSACPYHERTYQRLAPQTYRPQEAGFHKHTHQTHVMLGAPAYPLQHEKQAAMYLLNNILGGGAMNSLLNLSLREKRGLVYNIESTYTPLSDTGYWAVYFAAEPENTAQCIALVKAELEHLRTTPLSEFALQKYKKQLMGQMAVAAENQENEALAMAKLMLYEHCAPVWQETFQHIQTLTPADLFQAANDAYAPTSLSMLQYR